MQRWRRDMRNLRFQHALDIAGINAEGQAHSGIDDARNLARLVAKMVAAGHNMTITNCD